MKKELKVIRLSSNKTIYVKNNSLN